MSENFNVPNFFALNVCDSYMQFSRKSKLKFQPFPYMERLPFLQHRPQGIFSRKEETNKLLKEETIFLKCAGDEVAIFGIWRKL